MDVLRESQTRDLYLTDGNNVFYIPKDWAAEQDENESEVQLQCYAPTGIEANDPIIEAMFIPELGLAQMREVSWFEALAIHPALFKHLDRINVGEPTHDEPGYEPDETRDARLSGERPQRFPTP